MAAADTDSNSKQAAILASSWRAFATYGFRKTSMEDIARGAGMSRPALYLHYRNKDDIYRHLVRQYYDDAAAAVEAALAGDGPVTERLAAAFAAQGGAAVEAMLTSPHGMELLDAGQSAAAEIIRQGEARLASVYAAWLEAAAQAGMIRLPGPAPTVAATLAAALKGLKMTAPDYPAYRARVALLAAMIGDGLARP
ncbi:helix-turn-helix domain-containing protein [Aquicoccus sp. SU-CL01552]|uniref:TetR/AcrR family transcriptional regulator n=1 Tax=Aquicoccus sp. SU-CL01552 TaxID=3127656 RepID=UPI0031064707